MTNDLRSEVVVDGGPAPRTARDDRPIRRSDRPVRPHRRVRAPDPQGREGAR